MKTPIPSVLKFLKSARTALITQDSSNCNNSSRRGYQGHCHGSAYPAVFHWAQGRAPKIGRSSECTHTQPTYIGWQDTGWSEESQPQTTVETAGTETFALWYYKTDKQHIWGFWWPVPQEGRAWQRMTSTLKKTQPRDERNKTPDNIIWILRGLKLQYLELELSFCHYWKSLDWWNSTSKPIHCSGQECSSNHLF